jgi:protein gp37
MEKSKIQWTDATVNFWTGCKKVSAGCKFCYMYRDKERYGKDPTTVMRTAPATFEAALKWKDSKRIFTCSWSDFFIEEADTWRADAWDIIRKTPHHQWQILTKRPERIAECLPPDWGDGWDNVWVGVSVESQDFTHRLESLAKIPAKVRFISAEPLIGPLDLSSLIEILPSFHWLIIGGESGNDTGKYGYRPCKMEWITDLIEQTDGTGINVFVKQTGTWLSKQLKLKDRHGGNLTEWPECIQVRSFPN